MECPRIEQLPDPPPGRSGWPWTEASGDVLPANAPDGSPWPRITVITPSFHQAAYLEETIRSVLLQGYPDLEYMVVDGGSTDGSVEIIKRYEPWLSWWVSERDDGQTDAIAKGFARATGRWFNWINSDDLFTPGTLAHVASQGATDPAPDLVAGRTDEFSAGVAESSVVIPRNLTVDSLITLRDVRYHQPSIWVRTNGVRDCGGLDTSFHYIFDRELYIRYLQRCPRVVETDRVLARFRLHSASKTVAESEAFFRENPRLLRKLAADPAFAKWQPFCLRKARQQARQLARLPWRRRIEDIATDFDRSRVGRAAQIVGASVIRPRTILDGTTWQTLRRVLFGKYRSAAHLEAVLAARGETRDQQLLAAARSDAPGSDGEAPGNDAS